jgi:hypothetical protein
VVKRSTAPKKDFQSRVIQVLDETKYRNGASRLQVIAWTVDGTPHAPKVARCEYAVKEDGTERLKKSGGLTRKDCEFLVAHWDEISMFL